MAHGAIPASHHARELQQAALLPHPIPSVKPWRQHLLTHHLPTQRKLSRAYDVTDLFRCLFPNAKTHLIIHQHETALYLFCESMSMDMVHCFMHWICADESASTLLTFETMRTSDDPAPTQPRPHCARPSSSSSSWFHPSFLTNSEPHPRNTNPIMPIIGLHVCGDHGDPAELACADAKMMQYFDGLQCQVSQCQ